MLDIDHGYRPRVVDDSVAAHLEAFGGLVIEGPKWCGKTWTGEHHANSVAYVDRPAVMDRALIDPEGVLEGRRPRLVDEWQDVPVLWDAARRAIDDAGEPGQFIFTGSAVPSGELPRHTGTGRFARLRMRPMSLWEMGESSGAVSLRTLFDGAPLTPSDSSMDYPKAIRLICRGGWPASLGRPDRAALLLPAQYVRFVAGSDISRADGVERDPRKVLALLRSIARNTATPAKATTLQADIEGEQGRAGDVSLGAVRNYLDSLARIFVLDDLPAWRYALRSATQTRTSPIRHLADPSLAAAALGAKPEILANDPVTAGFLFESLVVRDLRVYASAIDGDVMHYRDKDGLEADAIVQRPDGAWGAIEVKLGAGQADAAARSLLCLRDKLSRALPPPAFLMVVTATGGFAHTRADGIHIVPLDCLGP